MTALLGRWSSKRMVSAAFLSVREKATRLPKKVLLDIKGKSVTEHLIERLRAARKPDLVVLCTSTDPRDTVLVEIAQQYGISYFRGSEGDKLDRYLQAAKKFSIDFMVIADGDDIFCDPTHIDRSIETYQRTNADYTVTSDLPLGAVLFGVKTEALEKVCAIKAESNTEVWGGYFTETGLFHVEHVQVEPELRHPEIRLTLDYPDDFALIQEIFERLYRPGEIISLQRVVKLLLDNPDLMKINHRAKELYMENLRRHPPIKLKPNYREILKNWA